MFPMYKIKGYFTVEAAMVLPVVFGAILFLIGIMFFQYDRCLMEQELGVYTIHSSRDKYEKDWWIDQEWRKEQRAEYDNRYLQWEREEFVIEREGNKIITQQSGRYHFLLTNPFVKDGKGYEAQRTFTIHRVNPVLVLRGIKKLQGE